MNMTQTAARHINLMEKTMNHMTTLGQVGNRVVDMSKNCFDEQISTVDIEFDSLDKINIAGRVLPALQYI